MVSNTKKVIIPIKDIDAFSVTKVISSRSNSSNRCNITLRYRIKSADGTKISEWSPVYDLAFYNSRYGTAFGALQIAKTNGFDTPSSDRTSPISAYTYGDPTLKMLQSAVERITAQSDASASPDVDLFKYSWVAPPSLNVKNFDVFLSWFTINYVHPTATLSAATGPSGGLYSGTLTLTGTGAQNAANTLRSYYNRMNSLGSPARITMSSNIVTTGAIASGGGAAGNYFTIVSGTSTNGTLTVFNIQSNQTWTAGTMKHVFKYNSYSDFEYAGTTSSNSYTFKRTSNSNTVTTTLTAGLSTFTLNEDVLYSGLAVGMTLRKIDGDGAFGSGATISAIDYFNNIITVSTDAIGTSPVTHTSTGYVTFVADNTDLVITLAGAVTQTIQWSMPLQVQPMLHASNLSRDYLSNYSLLSVPKSYSTFYGGFGVISGATTVAPFTASVVRMPFAISGSSIDYGRRVYATNSGGSMGGGLVTYADYTDSTSFVVASTTALTNGIITNLRF
jgi:hypothetical protein